MILAEYTLDHPILRHGRESVPDIEITWEDSHTAPGGREQFIAWVSCDDFAAADAAFRADGTVDNPTVLATSAGRRLYRFDLIGKGQATSIRPVMGAVGGVHQHLVATEDGWLNRTRFPDREGFEEVHRFCREHDIGFTLHRIREPSDDDESGADLTDTQRETLVAAVDSGYLEVPRQCTLAELGDRLGVSESAASERFRRGVRRLVDGTLDR
ncbi:MAG: helix-turn-helix domain-containing protein [Haloferacaceae archaeon]